MQQNIREMHRCQSTECSALAGTTVTTMLHNCPVIYPSVLSYFSQTAYEHNDVLHGCHCHQSITMQMMDENTRVSMSVSKLLTLLKTNT